MLIVFFFFQAEDGIRDHCVTGVQTCALPISLRGLAEGGRVAARRRHGRDPQPVGQLVNGGVEVGHSGDLITAIGSPDFTAPPSWTASSATVPALWAKISFSIFIASMMQTSAPSCTSAPCSTRTFQTLP